MSIWDFTPRDTFENDVASLYAKTSSQNHRLARLPPRPSQPDARLREASTTVLAADIESQLAEDFAFLASCEGIPPCVSAATITQIDDTGGICLSVAANEGVGHHVEQGFRQILNLLEQCASCYIPRVTCEENLLAVIIGFHRNRVFERLGSSKATRSSPELLKRWPIHRLKPMLPRLETWISNLQHKANRQRNDQDIPVLIQKAQTLHRAIIRAETLDGDVEHAALMSIINAAFDITERSGGRSLQAQFRRMGFDNDFTNRREFRNINAIANYRRICRYLTQAARSYHQLFRRMLLNVVPHNMPTRWRGAKRFVHAEIQLLIDREVYPKLYTARSIGTSKRACLLCYFFLRAHGRYDVSQTHGEVMPQWTVPDTPNYDVDSLERIRMALSVMASDIRAANKVAASTQANMPFGLVRIGAHSIEHLHFAPLRTPSIATVASINDDDVIIARQPIKTAQELPLADAIPETTSVDLARAMTCSTMLEIPPAITLPGDVSSVPSVTEVLSKTSLTTAAPVTSAHGIQPASTVKSSEGLTSPTPFLAASDSDIDLDERSNTYNITVSPTAPKIVQFDGCVVHLQFEDLLAAQQDLSSTVDVSQPVYQKAVCSFRMRLHGDPDVVIVDSFQISHEEDTALERKEHAKALEFGLRGRSGQVVIIKVQWLFPGTVES